MRPGATVALIARVTIASVGAVSPRVGMWPEQVLSPESVS